MRLDIVNSTLNKLLPKGAEVELSVIRNSDGFNIRISKVVDGEERHVDVGLDFFGDKKLAASIFVTGYLESAEEDPDSLPIRIRLSDTNKIHSVGLDAGIPTDEDTETAYLKERDGW